jgi:hypothetical protein
VLDGDHALEDFAVLESNLVRGSQSRNENQEAQQDTTHRSQIESSTWPQESRDSHQFDVTAGIDLPLVQIGDSPWFLAS